MIKSAAAHIEEIHSMLESGHRSVRVERHSLILWGLVTAGLIVLITTLITPDRFPIRWQRILISNTLITLIAAGAAYWDFRLTRFKREARDETLSFVQLQLTKVWWFLIAVIIVINIGMNVFGGGYLFYPILIILTGLGFYIHGLFSQQLIAWSGMLVVFAGLAGISLSMPIETLKWFAVFLFGMGLPAMAWLIDIPAVQKNSKYRLLTGLVWLCLIAVPTWAIHQLKDRVPTPDWPVVSLQEYQQRPEAKQADYVVRIPAGTLIPVSVNIKGNALSGDKPASIPLILTKSLEVVVSKGVADGRYRIDGGEWLKPKRKYKVRNYRLATNISDKLGIQIDLDFFLKISE